MIDLVYFLGSQSFKARDWEIRYSIRSFIKNFPNLGKIFIVGHRPEWLSINSNDLDGDHITKVIHIPFPDHFVSNKDGNMINRMVYCSSIDGLSTEFIRSSDDQILTRKTTISGFRRTFRVEWGDKALAKIKTIKVKGPWHKRMYNTILFLQSQGLPFHNYDCHVPQLIEKKKCIELAKCPYQIAPGLNINTLYFNYCHPERESVTIHGNHTLGSIRTRHTTSEKVREAINNHRFVEYNNEAMRCNEFIRQIEETFPDKLHHEN